MTDSWITYVIVPCLAVSYFFGPWFALWLASCRKMPDVYISVNCGGCEVEDDGDDPDEEEIEADVVPDGVPKEEERVVAN